MDIRDLRDSISYPCRWTYRVIGQDEPSIQACVAEILPHADYRLVAGNQSRNGRWLSMSLDLEVQSEEERLGTFQALGRDPRIMYVL